MKKYINLNREVVLAVIRMLRLPNLLIIVLTQALLRYSILKPLLFGGDDRMLSGNLDFILLVAATVLIAAGGYIINYYRDVPADQINKPGMNPFEKTIKARTGMVIYWAVNGTGILAGAFIAFRFRSILLGLVFPCIAILLWIYSSKYKQMLLVGNLVVAFLSSLVLLIVWYFEFLHLRLSPDTFAEVVPDMKLINWYFTAYSLFAFLVTFIREVIKDLEDVEGDRHVGCMTLPVVSGIKTSVRITAALIIITFLILSYAMVIFLNRDEILVFWYLAAAVQVPLLYLLVKLFLARTKSEFHFLSNLCKIIMVAGLLSIQLI